MNSSKILSNEIPIRFESYSDENLIEIDQFKIEIEGNSHAKKEVIEIPP